MFPATATPPARRGLIGAGLIVLIVAAWLAVLNPDPPQPRSTIPGDGVFVVGVDITPGAYRTIGPVGGTCLWARYRDGSAEAQSDPLDQDVAYGPAVVTIQPTDGLFETAGCETWSLTSS